MQFDEPFLFHVAYPFVQIQMFNTGRIERGGTAHDAVDLVPFLQQKFCEKGTVLSGYAGYECCLIHESRNFYESLVL